MFYVYPTEVGFKALNALRETVTGGFEVDDEIGSCQKDDYLIAGRARMFTKQAKGNVPETFYHQGEEGGDKPRMWVRMSGKHLLADKPVEKYAKQLGVSVAELCHHSMVALFLEDIPKKKKVQKSQVSLTLCEESLDRLDALGRDALGLLIANILENGEMPPMPGRADVSLRRVTSLKISCVKNLSALAEKTGTTKSKVVRAILLSQEAAAL